VAEHKRPDEDPGDDPEGGPETGSDAERLYLAVLHLARRLRDLDREAGVTSARFSALAALRFHGAMNLRDLARFERLGAPAASRLVADMERAGLVRRRRDPRDGRALRIEATGAGQRLVGRVRRRKIALFEEHVAQLRSRDRRALRHALRLLETWSRSGTS
jgi:DNA-binding MarR family transcriptional regulator